MNGHLELSDEQFIHQFATCTLNPKLFSHEAHIRLAWIHIRKYGEQIAIDHICDQIRAFDQTFGDGSKYNETVTVAAIKAVNHFIQRSKADTFIAFIQEFPRLKTNFKDLMACHYGFDIFNDTRAKKKYLAPDLLPFS